MYCYRCGGQLGEGHVYCAVCGVRVGAAMPTAVLSQGAFSRQVCTGSRVEEHRQLLGALWIAAGVLNVIFAGALFMLWRSWFEVHLPFLGSGFFNQLMRGTAVIVALKAFACLIAGYGLLERESWGRLWALVVAFISLLNVPVGTALGIYTLWVLLPGEPEPTVPRHVAQTL